MTTEELLALRKEKEAQVANMSIEQVVNGLKNDDPLYGLIARLYVARCMEWATGVAGDASKIPEQVQKAIKAAEEAYQSALQSEDSASEALAAAERLGAMEDEGKLLLKLLEDTKMSDNKAAYLAFLSRAAVPSVFKLMTTGIEVIQAEEIHVYKDYEKEEYNAALSPVTMHVDPDGIITFSDDCQLLISAQGGFGLNIGKTSRVFTCVDYYDAQTSSWPDLVSANDYLTGAGSVSQTITPVYHSYKKGTKLRFIAQNLSDNSVFIGGKGNVCYVQFLVLPYVSRFPTSEQPVIIDTGEIDEVVQSVGTASEAAAQATAAAQTAETAATDLSQAASQAQTAAGSAGNSAVASESWAVGGTGTRTGEDSDNAKYWSEQAQFAAGGGVTSFKGRAGIVQPQTGDYTPAQVGADAEGSADAALSQAKAYTDALKDDLTGTVESLVAEKASTSDIMQGVSALYDKEEGAKPREILSTLAGAALLTKKPRYNLVNYRLSEAVVGDVVYLRENGKPAPFYIAQTDYESALNGTGTVLLLRKDIHSMRAWHETNVNAYASSDIDAWLNGEYKGALDHEIQAAIKNTEFCYTTGNGVSTVTTLQRQVFLLSVTELGQSYSYANVEGTALPSANTMRNAALDGTAAIYWTRTPRYNNAVSVCYLQTNGTVGVANPITVACGARPAFVLPNSLTLSWYAKGSKVFGEQEYDDALSDVSGNVIPSLGGFAKIDMGTYMGNGLTGVANPNKLSFPFVPKMVFLTAVNGASYPYQVWAIGGSNMSSITYSNSIYQLFWTWDGTDVSYYSNNGVAFQFNVNNVEYMYVAIG